MRFSSTILALTGLLPIISSIPTKRHSSIELDTIILQYALTLEHLENVFYKEALSKWREEDFVADGFNKSVYNNLKYVAQDEERHVQFLEVGLRETGASPVAACTYKFPMSTPKEFMKLAAVIEGVGSSGYIGSASLITNKTYLTASHAILVTESLHQAFARGANGDVPMANIFGTPLSINATYTIASSFISSCPSTNQPLPFTAYPPLTLVGGGPTAPGNSIDIHPNSIPSGTYYITFVSGIDIVPVEPKSVANGMITVSVPMPISGQSYIFLTYDNTGSLTDENILAGPAVVEVTPNAPIFNLDIR